MSVRDNLMKCGKLYSLKIYLWWIMKNHCFFFPALTFVKSKDIMKSTSQNLIITSNRKTINNIYGVKRNSLTPKQTRTKKSLETLTQGTAMRIRLLSVKVKSFSIDAITRILPKERKDFYMVTYSLTCALKLH